jgi:hypothetical protein
MAEAAHTMVSPETSPRKEKNDYNIHLNFLSVEMDAPIVIYRRKRASSQE